MIGLKDFDLMSACLYFVDIYVRNSCNVDGTVLRSMFYCVLRITCRIEMV